MTCLPVSVCSTPSAPPSYRMAAEFCYNLYINALTFLFFLDYISLCRAGRYSLWAYYNYYHSTFLVDHCSVSQIFLVSAILRRLQNSKCVFLHSEVSISLSAFFRFDNAISSYRWLGYDFDNNIEHFLVVADFNLRCTF